MMQAAAPAHAPGALAGAVDDAVSIYRTLRAAETDLSRADPFAAHVFACTLTAAIIDARDVTENVSSAIGLDRAALTALIAEWLPAGGGLVDLAAEPSTIVLDEEESQLLALLDRFSADNAATTQRVAKIVTRRAMSPRHLWQDLGLVNRGELTRLIERWFPQLAADNTDNMKWKKFFYRKICELEGFNLCAAPTCRECNDFENCFGEENGDSALARLAR